MGIQTEYNPDLALRNISEFKLGNRLKEECLPESLESEQIHSFLKKGQRHYWLEGEIPLLETKGNSILSKPLASVIILEATHFLQEGQLWTKGKYQIIDVFNPQENKIHFNGFAKVSKSQQTKSQQI